MSMAAPLRILLMLCAIAVTLPLHETIHWVFMRIFGMKNARIEFAIDPLGLPSMRTVANGQMSLRKARVTLIAPFVLLTCIPDVLFIFMEEIPLFLFIAVLSNAAGCFFDIRAFFCEKENL